MTDDDELRPLVEALRRRLQFFEDRIDDLEEENEQLRGRVTELERVVDPDTAGSEYDRMTKAEKVYKLRVALVREAADRNGKTKMDYREVKALFSGYPSPGHCYDLMSAAANMDGFDYATPNGQGSNKQIRVNLDAVKDETLFHAANKEVEGGAA